jgi:hypothetical protein
VVRDPAPIPLERCSAPTRGARAMLEETASPVAGCHDQAVVSSLSSGRAIMSQKIATTAPKAGNPNTNQVRNKVKYIVAKPIARAGQRP